MFSWFYDYTAAARFTHRVAAAPPAHPPFDARAFDARAFDARAFDAPAFDAPAPIAPAGRSLPGARSLFCLVALSLAAQGCVGGADSDSDKANQGATDSDDGVTDTDNPVATDPPGPDSGGGGIDTLPVDEDAPLVGRFLLTLQEAKGNATSVSLFNGNVGDAPQPELTIWGLEIDDQATGCRLLTPRVPSCPGGCGSGACVEDETCAPYPTRHSVGDVTVSGVLTTDGASSITIAPQKPRLDYVKTASISLQYPPAPEGTLLRLTSEGGDYTPIAIEITAIAPLELVGDDALMLSTEAPLLLEWTAPNASGSHIEVKVDVSHHGGAKGKIVCETPDDGELEIPKNLTKALVELGVAGYPTVEITRVARGIGNVEAGRVEFQSISMDDRELLIPGLTSCMSDAECPAPQVCQVTRSCG